MRALTVAIVLLAPSSAWAFNDHMDYAAPAVDGGGGGRFFTGSPRDGYTCAVCHTGGEATSSTLAGLPADGYVPGQRYTITLAFPEEAETETEVVAAALEITDAVGDPVGTLGLPETLEPSDRCLPDMAGAVEDAVFVEEAGERRIAVSDGCGERRVRVTWDAPAMPVAGISIFAAVVRGDGDSLPVPEPGSGAEGDRVQLFEVPLPIQGEGPEGPRVGSACGVGRRGGGAWWVVSLLGVAVVRARRRG